MRTQGEIEAAICEGISRFEQDYMGRGPKDTSGRRSTQAIARWAAVFRQPAQALRQFHVRS
jgi:hypothetical protein